MILDTIDQAGRYTALHPLFHAAFDYLRDIDPEAAEPGTYELEGRRLYVILSRVPAQPPAEPVLEVHRKYIDLQVSLRGSFPIGWRALHECTCVRMPYDPEKEAALFDDPPESRIILGPGRFAVFFPEDAHAPGSPSEPLLKAVFKIAV